jgi:hypothetical protein
LREAQRDGVVATELGVDAGYLSRILRGFEAEEAARSL